MVEERAVSLLLVERRKRRVRGIDLPRTGSGRHARRRARGSVRQFDGRRSVAERGAPRLRAQRLRPMVAARPQPHRHVVDHDRARVDANVRPRHGRHVQGSLADVVAGWRWERSLLRFRSERQRRAVAQSRRKNAPSHDARPGPSRVADDFVGRAPHRVRARHGDLDLRYRERCNARARDRTARPVGDAPTRASDADAFVRRVRPLAGRQEARVHRARRRVRRGRGGGRRGAGDSDARRRGGRRARLGAR